MHIFRQKIILVLLLVLGMAGWAQATVCHCAVKIERLEHQLYNLPLQAANPSRVSQLVTKLSKMQPQYANLYFRWGISKLPYVDYDANASQLAKRVIRVVKNSTLPSKGVAKIANQVQQAVKTSTAPSTSPTA